MYAHHILKKIFLNETSKKELHERLETRILRN